MSDYIPEGKLDPSTFQSVMDAADVKYCLAKVSGYLFSTRCGLVVRDFESEAKTRLTFNSDKLGGIDFTKFSKLSMCSAGAGRCWLVQWPGFPPRHCTWSVLKFL